MRYWLVAGAFLGGLLALALALDALAEPRWTTFAGEALSCPLSTTAACEGEPNRSITTTRASPVPCLRDGVWTEVAANVMCVGPNGGECHGQVTNFWLRSAPVISWNFIGPECSITGPDAEGWYTVTDTSAAGFCYVGHTQTSPTSGAWTATVETASGTLSQVSVGIIDNGILMSGSTNFAPTAEGSRRSVTQTPAAGTPYIRGVLRLGATAAETGTVRVRQGQLEAGSTPGRRCDAGASPTTCSPDVPTVSTQGWPVAAGEIRLQYTPSTSGPAPAARYLLDSRASTSSTGVYLFIVAGSNTLAFGARDATSASAATGTLTWEAGRTYDLRATWRGTTLTLYRDGVQVAQQTSAVMPVGHNAVARVGVASYGSDNANGSIKLLSVESP